MMQFEILWLPLLRMLGSMFCTNKHMFSNAISLIITRISGYCVDGICNLSYVIIVDPTHANFVLQASFWGVAATIAIQTRLWHRNWHHEDDFIALAVKISGCLHQQTNDLLHWCANMAWSMKGFRGPPISIICSFYKHKVSMASQNVQAATILHWTIVAIREAFSRLGVLESFFIISLHNLLCGKS